MPYANPYLAERVYEQNQAMNRWLKLSADTVFSCTLANNPRRVIIGMLQRCDRNSVTIRGLAQTGVASWTRKPTEIRILAEWTDTDRIMTQELFH